MYSFILAIAIAHIFSVSSLNIGPLDGEHLMETDHVWTWECTETGCKKALIHESCHGKEQKHGCKNKTITRPAFGVEVCNLLCPPGNLWPQPTGEVSISPKYVSINSNSIALNINPQDSARTENKNCILNKGADKFLERFKKLNHKGKAIAHTKTRNLVLNLVLVSPHVYKYETNLDESYSLSIKQTSNNMMNVTIIGNTYPGVRHGLETLSQLMVVDSISGSVVLPSEVDISDKPTYTHRGIALDTSRNYIKVETILRTIEAMAAVKLNTLHWHITDSHSFPFVSKHFPLMSKYGAYSPEKVYTAKDIQLIVEYAHLHGIRVVPELDLPAHVGEGWQAEPGAVVCFNAQPWNSYCVEPPCGQIDPTNQKVYQILDGLYADFNEVFDADMFHMGGDEVNINCWNTSDVIVKNMKKMGYERTLEGFHQLWSSFQMKAKHSLQSNGGQHKKLVLWTSSLTEGDLEKYLNNTEYIIQVWTKGDDPSIGTLLKKGFKIILSNYDALYFDCGFGAWVGSGNNWCSPYIPWQKVYENTPDKLLKTLSLGKEFGNLILGSEAALWTEQADDASIDNRFWPRGAALAESLWSPGRTWQTAEKRYLIQRERFIEGGIAADTVEPQWCLQNQGSCYL